MPYRFLHSKRLKSKVLILAEVAKITKQMSGAGTLSFSEILKGMKRAEGQLEARWRGAFAIL
jgi:hypothetical protein